jgi:hypothetical protein
MKKLKSHLTPAGDALTHTEYVEFMKATAQNRAEVPNLLRFKADQLEGTGTRHCPVCILSKRTGKAYPVPFIAA